MEELTVFVSYSWEDMYYVDRICSDLKALGFKVIRDKDRIGFTQSISEYMKRIRIEKFVLLIISDNFLQSPGCMKEIVELKKDDYRWNVLLPILIKDTDIFSDNRLKYLEFWENKIASKEQRLRNVDPCNGALEWKDLQIERTITQDITDFLFELKDHLLCFPEDLWSTKYKAIIEKTDLKNFLNTPSEIKRISNKELSVILNNHLKYIQGYGKPADLSYYYLVNKTLVGRDILLCGINFQGTILRSANLIEADLTGCNLRVADLRGANMKYANVCDADLRGANLCGIKYDGMKLRGADFSLAIMDDKFRKYVEEHVN
ncbi:pentapeptide repeat-containing protein [Parabacteroides timonensis]|uniref:pentapeptide repeat-containing protein n=1 Tax=Parabacteroides timonensis TaxID=1871013 RepID=UPI001B30A3B1|nr:TIR domain-containing protein [Parabacteroides timonensis]